ncbi:MAG: DUF222 domain-containing protein [Pseudonocardiales bacterium]|nr:DUF222 domain-containing protein [Pseudonocardiales bacterium]MBV9729589.1 DUF222 domain-containing protein [Pseudonocardiales bacterium]
MPDTRTVPERQADALIELCERARATDEFPTTAGEPPHVTVTLDWDALRTALPLRPSGRVRAGRIQRSSAQWGQVAPGRSGRRWPDLVARPGGEIPGPSRCGGHRQSPGRVCWAPPGRGSAVSRSRQHGRRR